MRQDLKLHLLAGFIIGVWVAPWSIVGALVLTALAAGVRELLNKYGWWANKTGWDWTDIAYTLAGGVAGTVWGTVWGKLL